MCQDYDIIPTLRTNNFCHSFCLCSCVGHWTKQHLVNRLFWGFCFLINFWYVDDSHSNGIASFLWFTRLYTAYVLFTMLWHNCESIGRQMCPLNQRLKEHSTPIFIRNRLMWIKLISLDNIWNGFVWSSFNFHKSYFQ